MPCLRRPMSASGCAGVSSPTHRPSDGGAVANRLIFIQTNKLFPSLSWAFGFFSAELPPLS